MNYTVYREYSVDAKRYMKEGETIFKFNNPYEAVEFIEGSIDDMDDMFDAYSIDFDAKQHMSMYIKVFMNDKPKYSFSYDMNMRRFARYALWAMDV